MLGISWTDLRSEEHGTIQRLSTTVQYIAVLWPSRRGNDSIEFVTFTGTYLPFMIQISKQTKVLY